MPSWSASDGRTVAEAAVPIPTGPFGDRIRYSGVLSVASKRFAGPFVGPYELSLLRNASLRVALFSSQRESHAGASALARFISSSPASPRPSSKNAVPSQDQELRADLSLPEDLTGLRPDFSALVEEAARATGADSTVLRVIVTRASKSRTQHRLARFAVYPSAAANDEHWALPLKADCVTAWVARTGLPCKLPDVADPEAFNPYPGLTRTLKVLGRNTRSEVCLPILADGRLMGTLNFESRQRFGFEHTTGIAAAFAAEAGSLLERHRAAIAETVLSLASRLHRHSHYFLQQTDELEAISNAYPDIEIAGTLDRMRAVLRGVATSPRPPLRSRSLIHLIEEAIATTQGIQHRWLGIPPHEHLVELKHIRPVFEALTDIFDGVRTNKALGEPVFLNLSASMLGGKAFCDLVITETTQHPIARSLETKLFRLPVEPPSPQTGRPHLGSYTAGALLRSVGGDARIRLQAESPRYVHILAAFPVCS